MLELSHRELLWQQLEADGLEMNLTAKLVGCLAEDLVMVEGQRGYLVKRKPLSLGRIIATLDIADTN